MRKFHSLLTLSAIASRVAYFDPGKAGWKLTEDGKSVAIDGNGNPIWVTVDGSEQTVAGDTISRLNGEAKTNRERAEAAEGKLKAFDGIDPVKAKDALDTVGKIKQGDLIAAGKVDEVRQEITRSFEGKIGEAETRVKTVNDRLSNMLLTQAFTGSKWVTENLIVPPDMAQTFFGNRFKVDPETGKVTAMRADGSGEVYSKTRAGEVATFDEAVAIMVDEYGQKDKILKGANNQGSGNGGGGGNGPGGKRVLNRQQFDALPANERAAFAGEMRSGKAELAE